MKANGPVATQNHPGRVRSMARIFGRQHGRVDERARICQRPEPSLTRCKAGMRFEVGVDGYDFDRSSAATLPERPENSFALDPDLICSSNSRIRTVGRPSGSISPLRASQTPVSVAAPGLRLHGVASVTAPR